MLIVSVIGWKVDGFLGALVCTVAICAPSSALTFAIAHVWDRFRDAPLRKAIQHGLAPVTVGLVLASGFILARTVDHSARRRRADRGDGRAGAGDAPASAVDARRRRGGRRVRRRLGRRACRSCPMSPSTSKRSSGASSGTGWSEIRLEQSVRASHRGAARRGRRRDGASVGVRRLGKRIVIALEGELFLVLHLMIAGRLRWLARGSQAAGAYHAGDLRVRHRRAGVHRSGHAQARLAAPRRAAPAALAAFDTRRRSRSTTPMPRAFAARLTAGKPYAQARADRSAIVQRHRQRLLRRDPASRPPVAAGADPQAQHRGDRAAVRLGQGGTGRMDRAPAATKRAKTFPQASPPSGRRWRCMAASASRARIAARRCSASSTRTTKPITARIARPEARCSPIGRCHAC